MHYKPPSFPTRMRVLQKTEGCCVYCGIRLPVNVSEWVCEHMVSRRVGGRNAIDNLVPCCQRCNRKKCKDNPEEFRMKLRYQMAASVLQITDVLRHYTHTLDNPSRWALEDTLKRLRDQIEKLEIRFAHEDALGEWGVPVEAPAEVEE